MIYLKGIFNPLQTKKGFTLIELLMVLAIIGLLASIALASLRSARDKGNDASIKSALYNMHSQASIVYDSSGTGSGIVGYTNVCSDPTLLKALQEAKSKSGATSITTAYGTPGSLTTVTCHAWGDNWAIESPLKTDATKMFCVDKTKSVITTGSTLSNSDASCN